MDDAQILIRISELERKVSLLYRHLDLAEPQLGDGDVSPEVLAALEAGKTIEAIRIHRDQTGTDLAAAKEHVEAFWARGGRG